MTSSKTYILTLVWSPAPSSDLITLPSPLLVGLQQLWTCQASLWLLLMLFLCQEGPACCLLLIREALAHSPFLEGASSDNHI